MTAPLRLLLIDDEPLARDRLRHLLSREEGVEILAECGDGPGALEAVRLHGPDLLLLDVRMPGMDGFEFLRALSGGGAPLPAIIFVTAYQEHAVRAFETRALDYLLKPTNQARLHQALGRARETLAAGRSDSTQALMELLSERDAAAASKRRRLAVRTGDRTVFVAPEEVDWVEAAGNYVILHVAKTTHILRETMAALETQLPADTFLRVSRSALLNLRRVKELHCVCAGEYMANLADGQRIPITRSVREIEERLRSL